MTIDDRTYNSFVSEIRELSMLAFEAKILSITTMDELGKDNEPKLRALLRELSRRIDLLKKDMTEVENH